MQDVGTERLCWEAHCAYAPGPGSHLTSLDTHVISTAGRAHTQGASGDEAPKSISSAVRGSQATFWGRKRSPPNLKGHAEENTATCPPLGTQRPC